jgi:hypothetical protein
MYLNVPYCYGCITRSEECKSAVESFLFRLFFHCMDMNAEGPGYLQGQQTNFDPCVI